MKLVYIASPYSDNVEQNTIFARNFLLDAVLHNVVPVAPHLLYPQILDEQDEDERNLGKNLGIELLIHCDELWVYGKHISAGMQEEINTAVEFEIPIIYREEINENVYLP